MKKIIIGGSSVAACLLLLLIFKNVLIKNGIEAVVKKMTGLELSIGSLDIGLLSTKVNIRNMKLLNTPSFPEKVMLDIGKLFVDIELSSVFQDTIHIEDSELDLRELSLIRNKEGKLNINTLTAISKKTGKPRHPSKKEEATHGRQISFDRISLKIGRVSYKDYALGVTPLVKTVKINIHEVYYNIHSIDNLLIIIIVRALERSGIPQLADIDLKSLRSAASEAMKQRICTANQAMQKEFPAPAGEVTKLLGNEADKSLKKN